MSYQSVADVETRLTKAGYIPSREIATVIFLAQATQKPVLIEGPAGVGKTELAKAVARSLGRELIRLQCYEGLTRPRHFMNGSMPSSCSTPRWSRTKSTISSELRQP